MDWTAIEGTPYPLGATWVESASAWNFALYSKDAGLPDKPAKMLRADLAAGRDAWIKRAITEEDAKRRRASRFLKFQDAEGRVADFHALRHTFTTNLAKGNVNPRLAQSLARHSTRKWVRFWARERSPIALLLSSRDRATVQPLPIRVAVNPMVTGLSTPIGIG